MSHTISHTMTYTSKLLASGLPTTLWTALKTKTQSIVLHIQITQMTRALNGFSNAQLGQIGVTRDGVAAHAKKIVTYEYNGL